MAPSPLPADGPSPRIGSGPRRAGLVIGLVVAIAFALVATAVGGWWYVGRADDGPASGTVQRPAPPLTPSDDPARGDIRFVDSGGIVPGPTAAVSVTPPPGANEMQIGFDPSFATVAWSPVAAEIEVPLPATGYQMLFGRFRSGADAPPSPVSVDGLTVDPTYDAAVSAASGLQEASWVRPLSPTALMVRVEAGRIERGVQEPYDFAAPPAGDEISGSLGDGNATVERDGEPYGQQVVGHDDLLRPYDRLVGRAIDHQGLQDGDWGLTSPGGGPVVATTVERISRPAGNGFGPDNSNVVAMVHDIILTFSQPYEMGQVLRIEPPAGLVAPIETTIDPASTISPLVHVNQNGFAPGDGLKVGYLGGLPDGRGSLAPILTEGRRFQVVDVGSGAVAFEGAATERVAPDELEQGDLTGSATFELDFSAVTDPGRYQVCVAEVGCSEVFPINDHVWQDLAVGIARAMYHQRSGIALGPPYSAIGRPRPYHPDDGMEVTASAYRWVDSLEDVDQVFVQIAGQDTGEVEPEAWGGHFDAGDWDRRIQHLYYTRAVAELVEADPERWADLDLNIPESGDAIPDLLDEGLWTLDLFRRLQSPDGGVSGGVEASEHPQTGNTSWSDALAVYTYAPDPMASFIYAGVAAQVAAILEPYDAERAADYLESARSAMAWATAQEIDPQIADQLLIERSVAAAALLKATGEAAWHDLFVESSTLDDGVDRYLSCHEHGRCDAGWIYLSTDEAFTEPELRATIEESYTATADEVLAAADTTAYGWTVENRFVPLVWGLGVGGAPKATALVRAYQLTGDERYRDGALRSSGVSLGANPLNAVYVTGVGVNPVAHPLIVDSNHGGLPVWVGTPVYGDHRVDLLADESWFTDYLLGPAGTTPAAADLPYLWQWFDVANVAQFNEYTVFQSHAPALYTFALLASAAG